MDTMAEPPLADAVIIGGGVVGCAVFRELTLGGAKTVLIERASDLLTGASKGNSAILHSGFDATPGSLEARLVSAGYRRYVELHDKLGLPMERCGALVAAWSSTERDRLSRIAEQACANGHPDVVL